MRLWNCGIWIRPNLQKVSQNFTNGLKLTELLVITTDKQQINTGNATLDLEPVYTYRGHTSRVLSLCINGNTFYSGSQNGEIISWTIPSNVMNIDPYDPYNAKLQLNNLSAHENAIWSLVTLTSAASNTQVLCSAAADNTIKVWDTSQFTCLKSIAHEGKTFLK